MKRNTSLLHTVKSLLIPYGISTFMVAFRNFAITAIMAWVSSRVLTLVAFGSLTGFWREICLFLLIILLFVVFDTFGVFWQSVTVHRMTNRIRGVLYQKILYAPLEQISRLGQRGELLSRLNQDVDTASGILSYTVLTPFMFLISGVGATISILAIHWPTCVLIYLYGLFLLAYQVTIAKKDKRVLKGLQENQADTLSSFLETNRGSLAIRLSSLMDGMQERISSQLKQYGILSRRHAIWKGAESAGSAATNLFESVGILLIGAFLYQQGKIPLGSIVILHQLSGLIITMITTIASTFSQLQGSLVGLSRIEEMISLPQVCLQDGQAVIMDENRAAQGIIADNMGFTFHNGKSLYQDVTFATKTKGIYAVTGESGKGKTTLFRLLLGLYGSYSGNLRIFDQEIAQACLKDLRGQITYITQENALFEATIRENLLWRSPGIPDETIWRLLKDLGLEDWIWGLPMQLDTTIPDSGTCFSGGQRKSLLLTRAILEDRRVLLLDEVFAGIDQNKITGMTAYLQRLASEKLILIITHDPLVIEKCQEQIQLN